MYSLIIDSENAGDFHDWPETWRRTSDAPAPLPATAERVVRRQAGNKSRETTSSL